VTTHRLVGLALHVLPDTDADAAKVTEILTRAAIGLALDGISAEVRCTPYDHDPDDDPS
jgi:hypothetical protein